MFPNPACPVLTTHLTVDPLFPVDTFIENQATATDGDGTVQSNVDKVKVGTFAGSNLTLRYPVRPQHDSDLYVTRFTLLPGQSIDPANEAFHFQVSNVARGTFVDFSLPAGAIPSNGGMGFVYRAQPPGLTRVAIIQIAPSNYSLQVRATRTEGRLDLSRLAAEVPDWRQRQAWACGPEAMLNSAEQAWSAAGIKDRLHLERFAVSKAAPAGAGGTVTFAKSGRSVVADAATSLMTESSTPPERTNVQRSTSAGNAVVHSSISCLRAVSGVDGEENRSPR